MVPSAPWLAFTSPCSVKASCFKVTLLGMMGFCFVLFSVLEVEPGVFTLSYISSIFYFFSLTQNLTKLLSRAQVGLEFTILLPPSPRVLGMTAVPTSPSLMFNFISQHPWLWWARYLVRHCSECVYENWKDLPGSTWSHRLSKPDSPPQGDGPHPVSWRLEQNKKSEEEETTAWMLNLGHLCLLHLWTWSETWTFPMS